MKVNVCWFSYGEDEQLLLESVRSVRATLGDALGKIFIFDDGFCSVSRETRRCFDEDEGICYEKTYYPRQGNLIGPENLKQQTALMLKAGGDADILLKIDCDTLLLKEDWIRALYDDPMATLAGSFKGLHNYPMGHCYAVKTCELFQLKSDCEIFPAWANCFEDYEIGTRLHRFAFAALKDVQKSYDFAVRYRSGVEDGFWLCAPEQVNEQAVNARVVSCGFTYASARNKAAYKEAQYRTMQWLNLKREEAKKDAVPEVAEAQEDTQNDG